MHGWYRTSMRFVVRLVENESMDDFGRSVSLVLRLYPGRVPAFVSGSGVT